MAPRARRRRGLWATAIVLLILVSAAGAAGARRYVDDRERALRAAELTGGNPDLAPAIFAGRGCVTCHTIPGVRGADARVGPDLTGLAGRLYIAGVLPNAPDNLMRWVRDPRAVDPLTAMPNTGVTEAEARHIAAYLSARRGRYN